MLVSHMKIITLLIITLLSSAVYSSALVYPTATKIDISGVIGEKGSLKTVTYRLVAGYIDKVSPFPSNQQQLDELKVSVSGTKLLVKDGQYRGLSGVDLDEIQISYIQRWSDKNTIEISLPYGERQSCTNHDDGSTHYRKTKKILLFSVSGAYIRSNEKRACEH